MYARRILIALAVLSLAACTAIGPVKSEDAESHIAKVVPAEDGAVEMWSAAEWMPDQRGLPTFGQQMTGGINVRQGIVILTPASMLFAQWDKAQETYRILLRIPYAEMQDSEIKSFGRSRMIILTEKNFRTHTFNILGKSGAMIDQEASDRFAEYIKAKRG
jgi:hypothetical protein